MPAQFISLHKNAKNISGQRFGRLLVLGPVEIVKYASGANAVRWLCRCDCGETKIVNVGKLTNGNTSSCGCLQRETRLVNAAKAFIRHGMSKSAEYNIWRGILKRCDIPSTTHFKDYGGRGITVCERWRTFENFYADMGSRPSSQHSIDRKNNDGNYEPDNCRWATKKQQSRNTRLNYVITAFGRTAPLIEFFDEVSTTYHRVWQRIKRGWEPERALTQESRRATCQS